jgi:hypothetical protein
MGQDVGIGSDRYCGCYRFKVQQGWRKDPLGDPSSSRESVTGLTVRKHATVIYEWVRFVCQQVYKRSNEVGSWDCLNLIIQGFRIAEPVFYHVGSHPKG